MGTVYLISCVVITAYGCYVIHKVRQAHRNPNTIQELLDMTQCLPTGYEVNIKFIKDVVIIDVVMPDGVVGGRLLGLVELPGELASVGNVRCWFCDFVHRAQQDHHVRDDNKVKEVRS